MYCPQTGKNCQLTGCTDFLKACSTWNTNNKMTLVPTEKEKQLEQRVRELELKVSQLEAQLFNARAAAPPYKHY